MRKNNFRIRARSLFSKTEEQLSYQKKKNLTSFILVISLFLGISKTNAQCGFITGEGCIGTDYNNAFINSNNNAVTIEYDNYTSAYHGTAVRQYDGTFEVWGQNMANAGTNSTAGNALSPITLNGTNFPAIGNEKVLKVTGGSAGGNAQQFIALTSNGLYAWGWQGYILSTSLTTSSTFQKIAVNGKSDGLPPGVSPGDVKMMTGSVLRIGGSGASDADGTLCIVTCSGNVWVLSENATARGNGSTGNATTWYQITESTSGNPFLNNVVAARVSGGTVMALKNDGTVWTWGYRTYLGNDTAQSSTRNRATQMDLSNLSGTVKMIGVTSMNLDSSPLGSSYYILMTDGNLYALGQNSQRQLGDWSTTERRIWVQPRYVSSTGQIMNNIQWISPNEHDSRYAGINVINSSNQLYNWGYNDGSMLGRGTTNASVNPGIPNGLTASSIITSVQTGGHTTMITEQCQTNYGYVGHRIDGSMGSNSGTDTDETSFTFNTAYVTICASLVPTITLDPQTKGGTGKYCVGVEFDLTAIPSGGTVTANTGPVIITGSATTGYRVIFTSAGTATITYQTPAGTCPIRTITETFQSETCNLINAVDDVYTSVNSGSTTASVIVNDKNNAGGQAVIGTSAGQVSIATSGTWPAGFTLNANGSISIASTVTPGIYAMDYIICNQTSGSPCDTANISITTVAPYDCTGKIYSLSSVTGEIREFNTPATSGALGSVINTTPHPNALSAAPNGPNALGYSNATRKFYYVLNQNNGTNITFVSYDAATDTYENLATTNGFIYRGTVTNDGLGYYGITSTNVLKYYDIANNTWTNITNNYVDQNGVSLNVLLNTYSGGDIAMDGNGDLWILAGTTSSNTAYVFRVKSAVPKTNMAGAPLVLEQIVKQNIGASPNGISFNSSGELFITNNSTLFRMNSDFSISSIGNISPVNGGGDLASCAFPTALFPLSDFGDAPDSYKTMLSSDGPRHTASQYDATNNTAALMIGSAIDLENDGFAGVMSNGDDVNNIFDEGSVTFPVLNSTSATYSATIPVINTTGITASLKGWIDFNKNGVFDSSESASVSVPDGATNVTLTWSGLSGLTEGITYYRLRIAKSATEIANPTGTAFGGEVEDGKFTISGPAFCYEDPTLVAGATYPVKHGITVLGRAGTDNGNWPMLRNSAYTALEGKTKGLVITRNSSPETTIAIPVVGMMVFDTDEKAGAGCLKIYTGSGAGEGWKCFDSQTCP